MDFFDAMEEMKKGEKVKLKCWDEDSYIGLQEEEIKEFGRKKTRYHVITQDGEKLSPMISFTALLESEWEIRDED